MKPRFPFCLLPPLLLPALAPAAPELPVKDPGEIIEGLPNLNAMDEGAKAPEPAPTAPLTVEQATARLESARRKLARWEKLARQGVLSRAEAESCAPEVSEALVRYQRACLARAVAELAAVQARGAEPALRENAAADVETARQLLAEAEAQALQSKLRLAQATLDRTRRLFAEKLIGRGQVERAQAALAALQTQAAAGGATP